MFGAISAANSLSDVYAMGGTPITAMGIVCFHPSLPLEILAEILKGGIDKVNESGAVMVGGHSIKDKEPKYGLSVTGLIHPDKIITNCNLQVGDSLILTKPLGTGVLTTALKKKKITEDEIKDCIEGMLLLNKSACEIMMATGVNSCTDITGFGFLGHLSEMCKGSNKSAEIFSKNFKYYNNAFKFAEEEVVPGGCKENLKIAIEEGIAFSENIFLAEKYLLADPQTSGGLLISVEQSKEQIMLSRLLENGINASVIGWVKAGKGINVI